jgi:hypothetical protein
MIGCKKRDARSSSHSFSNVLELGLRHRWRAVDFIVVADNALEERGKRGGEAVEA